MNFVPVGVRDYIRNAVRQQTLNYRVLHLKCNQTTVMCYGTKIKSEAGPPPCKVSQTPL
jgi:hypothetical protein